MTQETVFPYKCECSFSGKFIKDKHNIRCPQCTGSFLLEDDIIAFTQKVSNQSEIYDSVYSSGYHTLSQMKTSELDSNEEFINNDMFSPLAEFYLEKAGYHLDEKLENLSILDAACGSGLITATILRHKNVRNCKVHAFDISSHGVRHLKHSLSNQYRSNLWELSVQDALQMHFANNTFDVIIGSSILHHFDDYPFFLKECFNALKSGGKAVFGEPFGVGYGLIYSVMKIVSQEMSIHYPLLDALYNDVAVRIKNVHNRQFLEQLVDKHIFFGDELINLGKEIGYDSVSITPANNLEYLENSLMDQSCDEVGVNDDDFRQKCKAFYKIILDMFKSESTFYRTLSSFNYLVFTK